MKRPSMRRYSLSEGLWQGLSAHLPDRGTHTNNRRFLEAVLWIAKTGAPWRDLPPRLGKWNSVYQRFNRLSKSGVWQRLLEVCPDRELKQLLTDSTIIKVHQPKAGAAKKRGGRLWGIPAGD